VTSLSKLLATTVPLPAVEDVLVRHFLDVFERHPADREDTQAVVVG
jgi:hypothetical protein